MQPEEKIHVAYAVSRRGGTTYRAVAVVWHERTSTWHTRTICLDDTPEAAVNGALQYVADSYRRIGATMPADVVRHGKLAAVDVDGTHFPRRKIAA
jgi:hypothetical protein